MILVIPTNAKLTQIEYNAKILSDFMHSVAEYLKL